MPWEAIGKPEGQAGLENFGARGCVCDMADCVVWAEAGWRVVAKAGPTGFAGRLKGFEGCSTVPVKLVELPRVVEEEEKVEDWAGVWGAWAGRKVVSMLP